MRFMNIASGSSGNCSMVGSDTHTILIDVGISKKRIEDGLQLEGYRLSDISGIFITHEHIDHVSALGVILRKYRIPVYTTAATCDAIMCMDKLGAFDHTLLNPIEPNIPAYIGDLKIIAHPILHDAVDPVCYTIECGGKKISIATDLGDYDDILVDALSDADVLLIEANHDIRMLEAGPYSYQLKQRIKSSRGHLSNEAGGRLITSLVNEHTKYIYLGHLSKENNYPELAYETVKMELLETPYAGAFEELNLVVAKRDMADDLIEF